jgi:hypothetical protein
MDFDAKRITRPPGEWNIFQSGLKFPPALITTRMGNSACPRARRSARRESSGNPMLIVSASTVARPTSKASPVERISRSRDLSRGEVKSEGVRLRVETFPSIVIAKLAITVGRCDLGSTNSSSCHFPIDAVSISSISASIS